MIFARRAADPAAVAAPRGGCDRTLGMSVKDIRQQTAQTVSSITTVDLRGISRIEEAFVLVLAAAAMALFVASALAERRHELATMAALGASLRQSPRSSGARRRSCSSPRSLLAALLGWLLAEMLVAMLQHVFDPPPDHLAVPWGFLGSALAAALAARRRGARGVATAIRRFPLGAILRGAMTIPAMSLSGASSPRRRGRRRAAARPRSRLARGRVRGRRGEPRPRTLVELHRAAIAGRARDRRRAPDTDGRDLVPGAPRARGSRRPSSS